DSEDYNIIPEYFSNDNILFVKYAETKYARKFSFNPTRNWNRFWRTGFSALSTLKEEVPERVDETLAAALSGKENKHLAAWREFSKNIAKESRIRSFDSLVKDEFVKYMLGKYEDADIIKDKFDINIHGFRLPYEYPYLRGKEVKDTAFILEYKNFFEETGGWEKWTSPIMFDGEFLSYLRRKTPDIAGLNSTYGTSYPSFAEVTLSAAAPQNGIKEEWLEYVRRRIPFKFCLLRADAEKFKAFIEKEAGSAADFNRRSGMNIQSLDEIKAPSEQPENSYLRSLWRKYLTKEAAAEELRVNTVDTEFRHAMQEKYKSVAELNKDWGTEFKTFSAVTVPLLEEDADVFVKERSDWRWHFLTYNYKVVWDYIAVHGRALWNTAFLCICTVLAQLTVNPFCAYALSRYKSKHTYKVLMFLVATMAFPPMVLMIPNFFFMRDMGMLNTYWALIVPSMASGYYIFMMKGFFDSLPRELYEAASIEGANEYVMFTKITLPLVKPIMAVKALGAFTGAYGGFMWAFIICQNPKMWTIMVYLYQFQMDNPYHLTMAALTLASVPLLFMFLFCQKLIMRGIVIPVMK
ncbi:MAG: carbohydrate ABC transporter permease, partial [Planctomycetota bacterium]